ncbi:hypothetical protein ABCS02_26370 [Microbacterium sp. X-17]|uniref:hypothetical protein n=1 Tax=Microbacterium sp. X-17 TaxID=3144404 RepID=UPI0031F4CF1C
MSADRSANERFRLTAEIAHVERREDEFSEFRDAYERSLEQFRQQFHSVTRRLESVLSRDPHPNSAARQEHEAQHELLFHVDRYVQESVEELAWTSTQVRMPLHDERERLIRERNALPWE